MDLRWLAAIRTDVGHRTAPTYEASVADGVCDANVATATVRPRLLSVVEDRTTRERLRGWPVGPALLETLGNLNADVRDALAAERNRFDRDGYPGDLPLPVLCWWSPAA
jgi:hypothetical protein